MLVPDVNVYVNAFRADADDHERDRSWLSEAVNGDELVGVSEQVLSSFVRIVTNHRIFKVPSRVDTAFEFCDELLSAPATIPVRPSETHWRRFVELCKRVQVHGNLVPDAYIAALALESNATVVSSDSGFARFPGLRVRRPGETE